MPTLRDFAEKSDSEPAGAVVASASWERQKVGFIFSGNGCQFREMGKTAYRTSASFRREITEIDSYFKPLAGWSLAESMQAGISPERLAQTSVSQPLIYAIQSALVGCLAKVGVRPSAVLGHSMGEVAAAEASGAISRAEAVRLIYLRSQHQEGVRGLGTMMVVATDAETVSKLIAAFGQGGIEIAAQNSSASTTVSGPADALSAFSTFCRRKKIATISLDIDYPFHSSALDGVKGDILRDLADLKTTKRRFPSCRR